MDQLKFLLRPLSGANAAKKEALDQVWEQAPEDWKDRARLVVYSMRGQAVTGEDIRLACEKREITPHHSNAWGAFISHLVRDGTLVHTERYVPMKALASHGRRTALYIVSGEIEVMVPLDGGRQ